MILDRKFLLDKMSGDVVFTLQDALGSLEWWKDFDLDTNRLNLDKSCVEMREMKTASINGRKKLNEATKVFRSKTREEQVLNMTELLKLYQDEIDQLSNRSKYSEKSFYNLYKQIYDAPNPATAMEGLIGLVTAGSTNSLEIERLKAELTQYDEEFQQLKNQDITIRRLEEQLQEYRDKIEDKVMEEVMKRTTEVEDQAEAHVTETKEVARASERRLAAAVESMRQAQASADRAQTQMFEISSQAEESVSALLAENGILAEGTPTSLPSSLSHSLSPSLSPFPVIITHTSSRKVQNDNNIPSFPVTNDTTVILTEASQLQLHASPIITLTLTP